jgi:hypothetical protein
MHFASLLISISLVSGCASAVGRPAASAQPAALAPRPADANPPNSAHQVVELRHFYLLSPGPNATLVVTRSDVPRAAP